MGVEKYLRSPLLRNEWDGARNSFDKLYGLVSTWRKCFAIFECEKPVMSDEEKERLDNFIQKQAELLRKKSDSLEEDLFDHIKKDEAEGKKHFTDFVELNKKLAEVEFESEKKLSESEALAEKLEKIECIVNIYKQLTETAIAEKDLFKKELEEKSKLIEEKEKKDGV